MCSIHVAHEHLKKKPIVRSLLCMKKPVERCIWKGCSGLEFNVVECDCLNLMLCLNYYYYYYYYYYFLYLLHVWNDDFENTVNICYFVKRSAWMPHVIIGPSHMVFELSIWTETLCFRSPPCCRAFAGYYAAAAAANQGSSGDWSHCIDSCSVQLKPWQCPLPLPPPPPNHHHFLWLGKEGLLPSSPPP